MIRQIFVNLPIRDMARSRTLFQSFQDFAQLPVDEAAAPVQM